MFGLCMPSGVVYLNHIDGKRENIEMVDLTNPRKHIMESKHILDWVKHYGYRNIESITYIRDGYKVTIPMADYYYEHAKELEQD